MLVHIRGWLMKESLYRISHKHTDRHTKIMQFGHKHALEHIRECWYIYGAGLWENPYIGYLISTLIGTRKLCSLVISILMSILENVGTYIGRAYENPYIRYLISTLIGAWNLCSLVISMLMSTLQNVGTYIWRAYENPFYRVSHKHADRHTKIMQFGHKHAHEHITECWYTYRACLWESLYSVSHKHTDRHTKVMQFGHKHAHEHIRECWYIYGAGLWENPYIGYLISTLIGTRKLCSLVISMLMSILENAGTYIGPAYENPYIGYLISTLIGAWKLCSLVISMLTSTLQNVGTYIRRAYENPFYRVSHKHADRHTKIMQFGHKHAHEHITECWYIYWACLWESLYRVSHKHATGRRK